MTAVSAAGLTAVNGSAAASALPRTAPSGDETTISQNDLRTGWDPNEPTYHGTYKVTWTDRSGSHSLLVPITGTVAR